MKLTKTLTTLSIAALLLLTGCTTPPGVAPGAPAAQEVTVAPSQSSNVPEAQPDPSQSVAEPSKAVQTEKWATVYDLLENAVPDPGRIVAPFGGEVVHLKGKPILAYQKPDGPELAWVPTEQLSDKTALPVIGKAEGGEWLRVLLPGRLSLPSSGKPVNSPTGWVQASDVSVKSGVPEVRVDLSAGTVTVQTADREKLGTFRILLDGEDLAVTGRGYFVSSYASEIQEACSTQPVAALSLQSEKTDSFVGTGIGLSALHGWSAECRAFSVERAKTSGCLNLANKDMKKLLALIQPGSPVEITGTSKAVKK